MEGEAGMARKNGSDIQKELQSIAQKHGGVVNPHAVVAFARNPKTALHSRFQWDDTRAAHLYRIEQARCLLRVFVTVHEETKRPYKVWASLPSDRTKQGGYRMTVDIMSHAARRQELLEMALAELRVFQEKYQSLKELSAVFDAIKTIRKRKAAI